MQQAECHETGKKVDVADGIGILRRHTLLKVKPEKYTVRGRDECGAERDPEAYRSQSDDCVAGFVPRHGTCSIQRENRIVSADPKDSTGIGYFCSRLSCEFRP